ncbi:PREDICTED: transforming growth factor beta regulator 1 [Nanorana parkeri]|uniref:transforming growth factor beta regulator 1 n=1 Tax=Nanorana parkeri TaxID=125878 RepID=UPI0008542A27|nr:PREDICTED: transforming growth factor beta regulator 1 [Nanorana parkeri]
MNPPFLSHSSYQEGKMKSKKRSHNEKYRVKCLRLRRLAKTMVFVSVLSSHHPSQVKVKEERRFLLKRVLQLQALSEDDRPTTHSSSLSLSFDMPSVSDGNLDISLPSVADNGLGKRLKKDKREKGKENKSEVVKKLTKRKRVTDGAQRRWVQPILLDPCGRPIFPIELDGLTVYSLGEIVPDRSGFHDRSAIYPVGFCSTRVYASMRNPEQKCLYTCQIKDGWTRPQFEIVPEDDPQNTISGSSAVECHNALLKSIGAVQGRRVSAPENTGPYFFGFTHPTIQNLIQSCPGARKCSSYEWVKFEVWKLGEGPMPQEVYENSSAISFEAFQEQSLEEMKPDNVLSDLFTVKQPDQYSNPAEHTPVGLQVTEQPCMWIQSPEEGCEIRRSALDMIKSVPDR